jgi:hypothetical protein
MSSQMKLNLFTGFKQTPGEAAMQATQTNPPATKPPSTPVRLMRKYLNGKTEVLEVGDVVVDIRGKTYYITGWDEYRSTIQATSMCESHYFVDVPAKTFNCYFIGE